MCARVASIGLRGMEGYLVHVEVKVMIGVDSLVIVGLPDASVKESKERVAAALHSQGYSLSSQKIIIHLSPAELKKNGPLFDLAMAISILVSLKELKPIIPEHTGFIGSLSLDGRVQPVEGMLPAVLAAKKLGLKKLYMPFDERLPALEFKDLEIVYVSSLEEVILHLNGQEIIPLFQRAKAVENQSYAADFKKIVGHSYAKYALEVAAAGEHHVFMTGPPGCGKSLLAETFPSIMPPLSKEAQLEMISLYQLSGSLWEHTEMPPFRNPHHSASGVSIVGGGQYPRPGEVSLAHRGVLFLDEIAEFTKKTLDMLRQPLESGKVSISRTQATVTYPASFILIGAMNPCPCGYAGSNTHYCTCTSKRIIAYQNKLSGPLRDRFDINLSLMPVHLKSNQSGSDESSSSIRNRVEEARKRQYERYGREICNSRVSYDILMKTSPLSPDHYRTLQQFSNKKNWSNRTQIKVIRLARTISDLEGSIGITDRSMWKAVKLNSLVERKAVTWIKANGI
ncbi:MAG: YifB family Mg chelatase-like AAA ATPase [Bacillota bacterium]